MSVDTNFSYKNDDVVVNCINVFDALNDGDLIGHINRLSDGKFQSVTPEGRVGQIHRTRNSAALSLRGLYRSSLKRAEILATNARNREDNRQPTGRDINLTYVRDDNDPSVYYVFDATLRGTQWDAQPVETGSVTRESHNRWRATPTGGGPAATGLLTRESAAHHLRSRATAAMRGAVPDGNFPEQPDCRCAARLAVNPLRTVHDVTGTDCPCICHPRNPRPAEAMTRHSQFNIHAMAREVVKATVMAAGPNHPNRAKYDTIVWAWCVLTGMPRAAALHLAAEIANREHLVAIVAPF